MIDRVRVGWTESGMMLICRRTAVNNWAYNLFGSLKFILESKDRKRELMVCTYLYFLFMLVRGYSEILNTLLI